MPSDPAHRFIVGEALQVLRTLPDESVGCVVTSPPFWALRDYGVDGQLGLERTPMRYLVALVRIFREVRRILRSDGTLWLEIGDCYAGDGGAGGGGWFGVRGPVEARVSQRERRGGGSRKAGAGLKIKDLVGIPWMVAFALRSRGWYLRQEIIWERPNSRPEGCQDRPHTSHSRVFLFSKSETYHYDAEAVKERANWGTKTRGAGSTMSPHTGPRQNPGRKARKTASGVGGLGGVSMDRHLRSVWTICTTPCEGTHVAAFPVELARRCILAGARPGDVVLDPFAGSGTVAWAAKILGRRSLGIELNPKWAAEAEGRLAQGTLPFDARASGGGGRRSSGVDQVEQLGMFPGGGDRG